MKHIWIAFGLTVFAGMATGIGSIIAFAAKRKNTRFLSLATGFSAGVMLYVSFVEIFFKGADQLTAAFGDQWGPWVNAASFFGGILLIGAIDMLIPSAENPHEMHAEEESAPLHGSEPPRPEILAAAGRGKGGPEPGFHDHTMRQRKLLRVGLFTAMAIAIHNLPEGLVTFLAALQNPALGVAIAVAIALHNIPEGHGPSRKTHLSALKSLYRSFRALHKIPRKGRFRLATRVYFHGYFFIRKSVFRLGSAPGSDKGGRTVRHLKFLAFCSLRVLFVWSLGSGNDGDATQAAKSLASILNEDGSLKSTVGLTASFDARGYKLVSGPGKAPRFAAIDSPQMSSLGGEGAAIQAAGDQYWDSQLGNFFIDGYVYALAVSGTNVYLGGSFTQAGGSEVNYIVMWNGSAWTTLGSGVKDWLIPGVTAEAQTTAMTRTAPAAGPQPRR